MHAEVSWLLAVGAGLLSFFSPCILPLLPAYLSFITGQTVEEILASRPGRRELLPQIILFCLGFSLIFVILGATASALGQMAARHQRVIEWVGGLVVIALGLHQMGAVQWRFLQVERRLHLRDRPAHILGAFVVGVAFAVGWTPCIGPVLGAILAYAGAQETLSQGFLLLAAFSVGLSLPFVAVGLALGSLLPRFRAAGRSMRWIMTASGALLILMGLLLITDQMRVVYRWVPA
jgi:cytochrome c-type biogenesis protein